MCSFPNKQVNMIIWLRLTVSVMQVMQQTRAPEINMKEVAIEFYGEAHGKIQVRI